MNEPQDLSMIGPGWRPIVSDLVEALETLDPNLNILQIKEKFGGLRFYYTIDPLFYEEAERRVGLATEQCDRTCEECGEPGELTNEGWYRTLCGACEQLLISRRKDLYG